MDLTTVRHGKVVLVLGTRNGSSKLCIVTEATSITTMF